MKQCSRLTENVCHENDGPSKSRIPGEGWNEIASEENEGPNCKTRKCFSWYSLPLWIWCRNSQLPCLGHDTRAKRYRPNSTYAGVDTRAVNRASFRIQGQGQGQELHVQGQDQGHYFLKNLSRTFADSLFYHSLHYFYRPKIGLIHRVSENNWTLYCFIISFLW